MTTIEAKRHSLAHLLGAAVKEIYGDEASLAIGPAIENGFYYDIDFPASIKIGEKELLKIQGKMEELLPTWTSFEKEEVNEKKAQASFSTSNGANPFKKELIDEIVSKGEPITLYTSGNFTDLCRGGHVENMNEIKKGSWKLTHVAGAYWRGSEKNPMLTRIYGLAFETKEELENYAHNQEEAKKRDHRKLGKELELFTIIDDVGPGLPLFYPKGALLRQLIEGFISEEQKKRGYEDIWIPHITKGKLYETSGHLDKYDAMYSPMVIDETDYYLKPMNCPHFMMLYGSRPHSYRDLPVRYTCTTTNYRYEKSGELSGLTRVRSLTQDDCHVFCENNQIEGEIELIIDMIKSVYSAFNLKNFYVRISLRDPKDKEKYLGGDEVWETAENALRALMKNTGWKYVEALGEAAFYGPKLDFMFKDVLEREWQLSTIQLDFNLPEKFDLTYVSKEGRQERPVVIHRAILGSTERFLGIMIEHYAGAFPLWLSPVQVKVLPIGEKHFTYSLKVLEALQAANIRAEMDASDETLGKKIRNAKTEKVPYSLVIGDKEVEGNKVTVESRDNGNQG
ncbi:MAG: threonine--tRNA ligase, partial [Parcubacteria group bacterium]